MVCRTGPVKSVHDPPFPGNWVSLKSAALDGVGTRPQPCHIPRMKERIRSLYHLALAAIAERGVRVVGRSPAAVQKMFSKLRKQASEKNQRPRKRDR